MLIIIAILAHYLLWDWLKEDPNGTIVRNGALMLAGIFGAYGVMVAARRVAIQERGQVAERYARAAEQLDGESESVRMVAVLALQRIAKEADEKTFFDVVQTLCSYVKERRPIKNEQGYPQHFPAHLQKIIDFLGEKETKQKLDKRGFRIDLSRTDLSHASFWRKDFSNSKFNGSCFKESECLVTTFRESEFFGADMEGANLIGTRMEKAHLLGANLKRVFLYEAKLKDASLIGANLENAVVGTNPEKVVIDANPESHRSYRFFRCEVAVGTNPEGVNLKGADFQGAKTTNIKGLDTVAGIESVENPTPEIIAEIERRKSATHKTSNS